MMPDQPFRDERKKQAYLEGCQVAANNGDRFDRPNYPTQDERDAFAKGWDDWWALNAPVTKG